MATTIGPQARPFPEIDRAAWFDPDTARRKLVRGQVEFVDGPAPGTSRG